MPALAAEHRVCRYDRPGTLRHGATVSITDRSSPVPMPRTAQNVVDDLHALLAAAGEPFPFPQGAPAELGALLDRIWPEGAQKLATLRPQTP